MSDDAITKIHCENRNCNKWIARIEKDCAIVLICPRCKQETRISFSYIVQLYEKHLLELRALEYTLARQSQPDNDDDLQPRMLIGGAGRKGEDGRKF